MLRLHVMLAVLLWAASGGAQSDAGAESGSESDAGASSETGAAAGTGSETDAGAGAGAGAAPEEAPITVLPRLLQSVEAVYPASAQAAGIEAEVVLQVDIGTAGQVEAVSVVQPATPGGHGFDEAAAAAVARFVFSPALAGEQPVPVRITYRYRFTLGAADGAADGAAEGADGEAPAEEALPDAVPAPPPGAAPGQVNFSGELVVRGTREPLPGLLVTIFRGKPGAPDQAFEAATDAEGRFVFYDLSPGRWNVLVEAEGFYPVRSKERVAPGEHLRVRYYVERGAYNPFDVLVEADRPRREVSRTSLQIEEIRRIPGTFGDALAVIQNLPGVARPALLSGQILVRGAAPEDTQVVVEDMSIPTIYHFGGFRSVIPTPMLSALDFYPGNFGPEHGRAIGGIVDVRLKRLRPERFGGMLDTSVFDTSLYLEAPITDDAAVAVAVRRSYVDFLIDAAVGDNEDLNLVTAPRYYDAQLLAQYRPADGHELRLFSMLSDDEFKLLFSNPGQGDVMLDGNQLLLGINFHRSLFDYVYTPDQHFQNTLRFAAGRDKTAFELAQFEFKLDVVSFQIRDTARFRVSDELALVVGIDHITTDADFRVFLPPPEREGETFQMGIEEAISSEGSLVEHSFGAFTQLEWEPVEEVAIIPGVRFDHFSRVNVNGLSPRLTTRVDVADKWVAKGGVGLFQQEPTFDETDEVFGNPELTSEKAVHYSAGVEYRPEGHLLVDVTGFYKTLHDLVAPSEEIVERDGELVEERVANTGEGRVYGAEVMLRHELHDGFMGWLAYTVMRSERRDRAGDPYRLFSYDQTHILTAILSRNLPRNWEISARWRLVTGNPDTPVIGAIFNADRDEFEPVFAALNSGRIAPFHQLDLKVEKRWIWDEVRLALYLDVLNIYNRANPEGKSYSYDYSESRKAQGLPIVPILGLTLEY